MEPFARTIDAAKKYVVSSALDRADWNAETRSRGSGQAVRQLKRESAEGLLVGGVKLPQALAALGLIDEYEFVVHPRVAGLGPTIFAGLSKRLDLKLVSRLELDSGRWRCGTNREDSYWVCQPFTLNDSSPPTPSFSSQAWPASRYAELARAKLPRLE